MKPGKPLKRTKLNPGKGFKPRAKALRSRGVLNRSSSLSRQAAAKPARPKRDPAEAPARKALKARSAGLCELCGREPATDAHHRLNRSQGGLWAVENLLHLCHREHMHLTVNPALAYERGWSVRSTQNPAEQPVWLAGRGWSYLTNDGGIVPVAEGSAA